MIVCSSWSNPTSSTSCRSPTRGRYPQWSHAEACAICYRLVNNANAVQEQTEHGVFNPILLQMSKHGLDHHAFLYGFGSGLHFSSLQERHAADAFVLSLLNLEHHRVRIPSAIVAHKNHQSTWCIEEPSAQPLLARCTGSQRGHFNPRG